MNDHQEQFSAFQITNEMIDEMQRLRELDCLYHEQEIPVVFQTVIQTENAIHEEKEEIRYVKLV